ncbi:sirohydrochlorin chelatase [Streptomyces sp. 8K308]|uniref:sirohydrochlorin chelatase n=1 Tax=Streptomyces sp. 8K308 TaxID=2530388 RepID=UPI001052D6F0|nr:sirohydrochlorin chelatase [Streptomyces sp. 8K308]TDC20887.1 sirohydrochlorin chelatase [Streptomyces sp. 8K308]
MTTPPPPSLLVVAHGSRDRRHAATVSALAARVRSLAPGTRVAVGYLDFDAPSVDRALTGLYAAGARRVVAVPLLLARAFHAKADIPAVLRASRRRLPGLTIRQADVLGPDPLLLAALERRLGLAGVRLADRADTGVVLASAGSSDPEAIAVFARTAREWRRTAGWCAVRPAFASGSRPTTADAVRALRADGVRRVAVAPCVIAPGRLPDRILAGAREAGADAVAAPLGAAPELAELLWRRYASAGGADLATAGHAPYGTYL